MQNHYFTTIDVNSFKMISHSTVITNIHFTSFNYQKVVILFQSSNILFLLEKRRGKRDIFMKDLAKK